MRVLTAVVCLTLVTATVAAAASAAPLSPLILGWERYFAVEPDPAVAGGRATATIRNTSGFSARRVQVLVEGLDAGGQPVEQRVVWLGSDFPAGGSRYVATPMTSAATYRVRVFAFDLDMTGGPR